MIRLTNVAYSYIGKHQRVDALRGVTYTFEPGKLYTIMGASGSGKSTLLSLLMGYARPTAGDICMDEVPITQIPPHRYRTEVASLIYQELNLLPHLTVLENAALSLQLRKVPRAEAYERAAKQLRALGLDDAYFKRMPSMLSGGEQQRVAIARAFCAEVKLLLADEPTGSLDSTNTQIVMRSFRQLVDEQGCTVIIVTHDPEVAKHADIPLRIKDGLLIS